MFLPGLPVDLIRACYTAAAGNEIATGKFDNRRSSAALAANTFGKYLGRPEAMPRLPGDRGTDWPAKQIQLEATLRFPWPGGRLPCLDAMITTSERLIGVESKRFEPFRIGRSARLSPAYWRPLWGTQMTQYEAMRNRLHEAEESFRYLDATELVRHAFGLRTAVHRDARRRGLSPLLLYVFAEPDHGPDGRAIPPDAHVAHRSEVARFKAAVAGDEVDFRAFSYRELLAGWVAAGSLEDIEHAGAVIRLFGP
jgi:hypothetical protein